MQGNWAEAEKLQGTQWIGDDLEKKPVSLLLLTPIVLVGMLEGYFCHPRKGILN